MIRAKRMPVSTGVWVFVWLAATVIMLAWMTDGLRPLQPSPNIVSPER